jgi:hypothetical protein
MSGILLPNGTPYRRPTDYSNLVFHWKLDETSAPLKDVGSAALDLSNLGSSGSVTLGRRAIFRKGMSTPNAGSAKRNCYYTANPSAAGHLVTGQALTVAAWIMLRSHNSNSNFVGKAYNSDLTTWATPFVTFALAANSGSNVANWSTTCGTAGSGTRVVTSSTVQLPLFQWLYVAGTYDGANQILYINGVQNASSAQTGNLDNSTFNSNRGGPYFVGGVPSTNVGADNQCVAGIIADVTVENAVQTEEVLMNRYLHGLGLFRGTN